MSDVDSAPSASLLATMPVEELLRRVEDDLQRDAPEDQVPHVTSTVTKALRAARQASDRDAQLLTFSSSLLNDIEGTSAVGAARASLERWHVPFPTYDLNETFVHNLHPWSSSPVPFVAPRGRRWTVLGRATAEPIGIPASPLTVNSEWVLHHARLGFNVLTYKTVRPRSHRPHPFPNWAYVHDSLPRLTPGQVRRVTTSAEPGSSPRRLDYLTSVNSCGVPSSEPAVWIEDVKRALAGLDSQQLLILSVMGDFEDRTGDALVDDFRLVASHADKCGVQAVELNLSCPSGIANGRQLPPICQDPQLVARIVEAVRPELDPETSLVVKLSYLEDDAIDAALRPIAELIDGVAGINALQTPVTRAGSADELFPGRPEGGLSGSPVRDLALGFVGSLRDFRDGIAADFDILGMGGVVCADDAVAFLDAGASAVQSAAGACMNHFLAQDVSDRLTGTGATPT